ncbi:MAG: inorganic phosphate transporter, partial [Robiginitomaculum sp.]
MALPSAKLINFSMADAGRLLASLAFLVLIYIFLQAKVSGVDSNTTMLVIAAVIGGYMAMNIGANDVANNVGPAVGAKAITLTGAIIIAIICESGGALIAGGDVVGTIKKGIIDQNFFAGNMETFIWAMTAALLSAAIWLNIATYIGAPVS